MTIEKTKRLVNEKYLRSLRGQPCLVCGQGGEAHHLMRAEKRGMARKTGDNWAVPLCHKCHMELHAFGNEQTWWDLEGIDAKEWASKNWEKYNEQH